MPREDSSPVRAADIAREIRDAIADGTYAPGARIPGENALVAQYGGSRMTVRSALAMLQNEGLTEAQQGRGVFVRQQRQLRRQGTERYARSRWRKAVLGAEAQNQGIKARRNITRLATVPAPRDIAERLNVDAGADVWTRQRLVYLENEPCQTADSYYPLDVVERTKLRETEPGASDFAELDDVGHTPTRIREEWHARMPTPDEADTLRLLPGTPVFVLLRTIFDQSDRPVEVMSATIRADMTALTYDFPVPD